MPLQRRLPKRGFKNINRVEYVAINFSNLEAICEKFQVTTVDPEFLYNNGFIKKTERIKILANGDLKSTLKISAHASSAKAKLTIEELGGSLTII
jgi:large subunit ribosomal protein L15